MIDPSKHFKVNDILVATRRGNPTFFQVSHVGKQLVNIWFCDRTISRLGNEGNLYRASPAPQKYPKFCLQKKPKRMMLKKGEVVGLPTLFGLAHRWDGHDLFLIAPE